MHIFLCPFQAQDFAWVCVIAQSAESFSYVGRIRDAGLYWQAEILGFSAMPAPTEFKA
jgi:hypothetical protein